MKVCGLNGGVSHTYPEPPPPGRLTEPPLEKRMVLEESLKLLTFGDSSRGKVGSPPELPVLTSQKPHPPTLSSSSHF